ncbi:MAG: hypothetical protein BWK79_17015 [Beggiatoa sp. IS2]|nr:MAG: hypothetical protein BWK79_17015 [Beggiatoa sp. IS2]
MKTKQSQSIVSLITRSQWRKHSLPAIIAITLTTIIVSNCDKDNKGDTSSPIVENATECEVLNVYDGDTITVKCPGQADKTKVRFYCIDTPEMKQQPWGEQSRDYLRSIIGKTVHVVEINKDRYGRTVGEVYSGNVNLNLAQVEAGKAAVYDAYCKKPEYKIAEEQAKKAKKGIWSTSGLHQTPWKWRNP